MRVVSGFTLAFVLGFAVALASGGASCSYSPDFKSGVTKCATSGQACPSGYTCNVSLGVCVSSEADGGAGTTGTGGRGGATSTAGTGGGAGSAGASGSAGSGTGGGAGGAGGCGDIASTQANCGACGHSCGAGMCMQGICQTFVIPNVTATSIAVDTNYLYYTQGKKVLRCPKIGCGQLAPTPLDDMGATGTDTWSVAVFNGSLFFMSAPTQSGTEHDDLFMCQLIGCTSPPPTFATARYAVAYLWNAGNDVYWSDMNDIKQTSRRTCQPNNGACDAPMVIIPESVDQRLLAASASEFYFVDALGLQKCTWAKCPGTTSTATGATLLLGPVGTGLVPTEVFYFNGLIYMQFGDANHTLSGAIRTCTPGDCDNHTAKTIIQGRDPLVGMTVDAQGEYWIEDNVLYMCTANGCLGGAKTLATGVTHTFNTALSTRPIVTDDAFIYWLDDDAGVVKALAK